MPSSRAWVDRVATAHGYAARIEPIGPVDPTLGSPTQMALFDRIAEFPSPALVTAPESTTGS